MNNSIAARSELVNIIKNGAVLLHGGEITYRNNDTWYPFRQDSNFYYLTEWPEPDTHAVILIKDSKPELHLFVQGAPKTHRLPSQVLMTKIQVISSSHSR